MSCMDNEGCFKSLKVHYYRRSKAEGSTVEVQYWRSKAEGPAMEVKENGGPTTEVQLWRSRKMEVQQRRSNTEGPILYKASPFELFLKKFKYDGHPRMSVKEERGKLKKECVGN